MASTTRFYQLLTTVTCDPDETSHAVQFLPIEESYPTGAISGTAGSSNLSIYYASLDDDIHYDVYVDTGRIDRLSALNSTPNIG